jgi:hypothetical protein
MGGSSLSNPIDKIIGSHANSRHCLRVVWVGLKYIRWIC